MPLAKCLFGMIPLSRHSVDRSARAFHSSTHNVVRTSCFEVVSDNRPNMLPQFHSNVVKRSHTLQCVSVIPLSSSGAVRVNK